MCALGVKLSSPSNFPPLKRSPGIPVRVFLQKQLVTYTPLKKKKKKGKKKKTPQEITSQWVGEARKQRCHRTSLLDAANKTSSFCSFCSLCRGISSMCVYTSVYVARGQLEIPSLVSPCLILLRQGLSLNREFTDLETS